MPVNAEQYNALRNRFTEAVRSGELEPGSPEAEAVARRLKDMKGEVQQQRAEQFRSVLDLTPTEPVEQNIRVPVPGGGLVRRSGTPDAPTETDKLNNAASSGTDIRTGLPNSLRAKADLLGSSPAAKAMALEYLVGEQLKEEGVNLPDGVPPVFKDSSTGQLAYWRRTDDGLRPTLVNPAGADTGDFADIVDESVDALFETSGATLGALAGGTTGSVPGAVGGGMAGAAAGSAASNVLRKEMARLAGLPDEVVDTISSEDILADALTIGALEGAIPAVIGTARFFSNLAKPDMSDADLSKLKDRMRQFVEDNNIIEDVTGVRFNATAGGLTGSPRMLILEGMGRRRAVGKGSEQLAQLDVENALNQGRALELLVKGRDAGPSLRSMEETGRDVSAAVTAPLRRGEEVVRTRQRDFDEAVQGLSDSPSAQAYAATQNEYSSVIQRLRNEESTAWGTFRELTEYNPDTGMSNIRLANPDNSPVRRVLGRLDAQSREALSTSLSNAQQSFIEDLGYRSKELKEALEAEAGRKLPPIGLDQRSLDLNQLHFLLSHLKKQRRTIQDNPGALQWRANDLGDIISALEDQLGSGQFRSPRGQFVKRETADQIRTAFMSANEATRVRAGLDQTRAAKTLLETERAADGGQRFVQSPEAVRQLLLKPRDPSMLATVMEATGPNFMGRSALLREMESMYRERVLMGGEFSQTAHDAFMRDYSGQLRMLTGRQDQGYMENLRELSDARKRADRQVEQLRTGLENVFGTKITSEDMFGANIVGRMMGNEGFTRDQVKRLRNRVGRVDDALWNDVLKNGQEWIRSQLATKGGMGASADALVNMLGSKREVLTELYGGRYVAGLDALSRTLKVMTTQQMQRGAREEVQTPLMYTLRTLFGPLSTTQRRISAAQKWVRNRQASMLQDIIANPQAIDTLMQTSRATPGSIRRLQGFLALGANVPDLPEEEQRTLRALQRRNPNVLQDLRGGQ